jgi:hypothetical protein
VLKFVPLIVTVAPTAPLVGLKPVMVGEGKIVKPVELVPVTPFTVTVIGPVVVPDCTTAVILVVVAAVTEALTPLNSTSLLDNVVLKFVPVITTGAPIAPLLGVKLVMVGVGTIKFAELVPVIPLTMTEIGPEVAPNGTEVVILVVDDAVTAAAVPLNVTVFSEGVLLKLVPVIVTTTPKPPLLGEKLVIEGVPKTVKLLELETVTPLKETEIGPEPAPIGTEVVILLLLKEVTIALVPLNSTRGADIKFDPEIITVVPIPAAVGLKLDIVGDGSTEKLVVLRTVTPLTVTEIFPEVAPDGTRAVILVADEAIMVAVVLLNFTT